MYNFSDPVCGRYGGMQHRHMRDKCCKAGCGEYCGGKQAFECQKGDGCCMSKINAICGEHGRRPPCKLPSKNLRYCIFLKYNKYYHFLGRFVSQTSFKLVFLTNIDPTNRVPKCNRLGGVCVEVKNEAKDDVECCPGLKCELGVCVDAGMMNNVSQI